MTASRLLTGIVFSNVPGATVATLSAAVPSMSAPMPGAFQPGRQGLQQELFRGLLAERQSARERRPDGHQSRLQDRFVLAPNYQAGKDAITCFKRYVKS